MLKRILSIVAAFCILCSVSFAAQEAVTGYELLPNGNFEQGKNSWNTSGEASFEIVTENPGEGTSSLEISSEGNAYIYQKPLLAPDSEYTVSFKVRGKEGTTGAIKLEMYDSDNESTEQKFDITAKRRWESKSFKFTTPENGAKYVFMVRLLGGGTIYYDEIKIMGKLSDEAAAIAEAEIEKSQATIEREPLEGSEELMINPSYEQLDANGNPQGLECYDTWGNYATVENRNAHEGDNCIKISASEVKNPWVRHTIKGLLPGAKYQLIGWYKSDNDKFAVKFEFYGQQDTANPYYNSTQTDFYQPTSTWKRFNYTITLPVLAEYCSIYVRNYGVGTIYADDLSFKLVEKPIRFERIETDEVFYYPEKTSGNATLDLNGFYSDENYTVDFSLCDGDSVLCEEKGLKFYNNRINWKYDLSYLTEKKKRYTIKAHISDGTGYEETIKQNIYRFDRPIAISNNGIYMSDGEAFSNQIVYHIYENDDIKYAKENGINVIQGALKSNAASMLQYLDEMDALGVKVAIPLYFNMKPAGHTTNISKTKEIVQAVKDHPAVFGYLIQDEPFAQGDPDMRKWLEESYYNIRLIDDNHPVMLCECYSNYIEESAKYIDFMIIDPYPGPLNDYLTHVSDVGELATRTLKGEKPALNLLQTFTWNGSAPQVGYVRHMAYQAYLAGQQYVGYYPWKNDSEDKVNLDKNIWWDEIVKFNTYDRPIIESHFMTKEDPTYNIYKDDDIWYESWVHGNDVYLALINRTKDAKNAEISLESQNGRVIINDFDIEVINGGSIADVTKSNNGYSVKLSGADSVLYKISPKNSPDFSKLNDVTFDDIDNYSWASDAIEKMYRNGIANKKGEKTYAPAESITRGDFAMYLVRTLGLYKISVENFSDVPENAEYAKELAIGKTAGILNGVGDNMFNPEATITRQDMMTIISRGLKLSGNAELGAFSDSSLIADYALAHVKAMISSGLIKGNADGTINPHGNTTRAEAAVIMYRILNYE